jgi:predicted CoA-binding protein
MDNHPPIEDLRPIYLESKVIAVVGASPDTSKRANIVPSYLQDEGYRIIPVNPNHDEILGQRSYATLADIPEPVDVVDVFRPADETPQIAEQAAAIGAKVLWLQLGIVSDAAAEIAHEAGMTYVSDLCMGVTHAKLGLGSGPNG